MRILAMVIALAGQADPGPGTDLVHIHVTATDEGGGALDDLRPADVSIVEEGTVRSVEAIRLVRASGAAEAGASTAPILSRADERAEASHEGTRIFGFFLDEYHVAPGPEGARVRDAVLRFVADEMGPRDLAVVLKPLDSLLAIRLTRDREALVGAIMSFEGRKGVLTPRNAFEEEFFAASPARVEALRAQITTAALSALVTHLGGLGSGRKALVMVSEGFGRESRRRGDMVPTLASIGRAAHRGGVVMYPLDPREDLPTVDPAAPTSDPDDQPDEGHRMLRELAESTEGVVLRGSEVSPTGFRRVSDDISRYHVVSFRSGAAGDGLFHALDVRIARAARVLAPSGHWTDSPLDRLRVTFAARAAAPPPPPEPPRRTSPLIRAWFGVARAADGLTRVSFVWEPADAVPGTRSRRRDPARVTFRAVASNGTPVFEGVVAAAGSVRPELAVASFDAPAGRLRIEMVIEDEDAARLDTDVRDVSIQAPDGPVALGTAAVYRARTARDFRALADNARAVPVASRVFSRGERLLIRLPAYAAGGAPRVSAALVSRAGRVMRQLAVAPGPLTDQHQVDVLLAGLAAGDYRVDVTAERDGGQATATVAFRVLP